MHSLKPWPIRPSSRFATHGVIASGSSSILTPSLVDLTYQTLMMLFIGLQQAGPNLNPLTFEQGVFFPGNENHGIWSSRDLVEVLPEQPRDWMPGAASACRRRRSARGRSGSPA